MECFIRKMTKQDKPQVLNMMRIFYNSNAVYTNGSEEIFNADIDNCVKDNPYLKGYVFEKDGLILGYGMIAKSFSTEFGKACVWIEDIYIKNEFRGLGIGSAFLDFVKKEHPDCLLRLEVEAENERAVNVYKKFGFTVLPYMEMKK